MGRAVQRSAVEWSGPAAAVALVRVYFGLEPSENLCLWRTHVHVHCMSKAPVMRCGVAAPRGRLSISFICVRACTVTVPVLL